MENSSCKLLKFPEQDAITNRLLTAFALIQKDETDKAFFYMQQCIDQMLDIMEKYENSFEVDRVYCALLDCKSRLEHLEYGVEQRD